VISQAIVVLSSLLEVSLSHNQPTDLVCSAVHVLIWIKIATEFSVETPTIFYVNSHS